MLRRRTLLKQQQPAGDINTVLLLHLDGSIVDSSMYAVPVGQGPGSSFATGKFGQSFVGYFLTAPEPSPIITPPGYINNVIASDFTIEMWSGPIILGIQNLLSLSESEGNRIFITEKIML